MRVIYPSYKGFIIGETTRSYVIIRKGGRQEQHGHISKSKRYGTRNKGLEACLTVANCIHKGKLADSHYLRGCQARLLEPEEYAVLHQVEKPKYINNRRY